ncbi:DUF4192 domain-containing protein [Pseudonocardia oroxyli]|uniref:DUF4192 domain-containing protein n=1 Tax=Pseudonocardia oroxyli TaxID=366584 RepID=UPI0015A38F5E|nr:DUF4192 domain-containing protein [Pseudonocardia oroxyli]
MPDAGPAPEPDAVVSVGTAGLLAGLPVLLGFRPRDSLVVVALGGATGRRVGLTLRVDLPPPGEDALRASVCASAAVAVARERPAAAAVVVVGGGPAPALVAEGAPPRVDVAAEAVLALADAGVAVPTVAWVAELEPGAPWCCYPLQGCGCAGRLPDPAGTELAATAVAQGTVVYRSREELEHLVAAAEPAREPVGGAEDRSAGVRGAPRWPAEPEHALRAALDAASANRLVVDAQLVRIMTSAFRRAAFRDRCLSVCTGPDAPAAEQLWAALARTCRGPAAADPAVLLAVCALARGAGALADIALERAERVRPNHRLARDLRAAMAAGWGPDRVRAWLAGEL